MSLWACRAYFGARLVHAWERLVYFWGWLMDTCPFITVFILYLAYLWFLSWAIPAARSW